MLAPDSLMAPIDAVQFQGRIALSPLTAKYAAVVDRESAHERISARVAAGRQDAAASAGAAGGAVGTVAGSRTVDPATGMTPAQQRREIERQARQMAAAQRAAERERKARAAARAKAERDRQRSIDNAIRTGGRVVTSRVGQDLLRGVFDTIFGGGKRR
jgi:DNA double-strand break repair helicase HerA and related ATPase